VQVDPLSDLALRYQAGERQLLAEIHARLGAAIERVLHAQLGHRLPGCLTPDDLRQESCVILAELVQRWDARRGTFAAYFHRSFPFALRRYVHRHRRRDRRVREVMMAHDALLIALDRRADPASQAVDEVVVWRQCLDALSPTLRAVLWLRHVEGLSFAEIGRALGKSKVAAHRLHARALDLLARTHAER